MSNGFDANQVWFTADQHFYHKNIIKYSNRPFDSVDEMNATMIERWNKRVQSDDLVYHLGDFSFSSRGKVKEVLEQLNGKILIIPGGHDNWIAAKDKERGLVVDKIMELEIRSGPTKHLIVMCHYPLFTWERSNYGSTHLHGHSHGGIGVVTQAGDHRTFHDSGYRIDVGVDNWGFYPINLEQVLEMAAKRAVKNE